VKRFTKKTPPDIVLYFDRLDMPMRDFGDLPLLRIVTETFGQALWFNAIVVLTHACTAPPDGNTGQPISYDMYIAQRSHVVQQMIRQAAGDLRLMNPVSLAENHPDCRRNNKGERVLPNGQLWKPQLLLLCFASKILTEANTLLNLKENNAKRQFMAQAKPKVPPLPFLLSSLLTARKPRKGPTEEELLEEAQYAAEDQEQGPPPKQVAIPAPDPALPPTFDSENPSHRFRFLESANQWMVRPIVEAHGWDHEAGIEGFSVDKGFVVRSKLPVNVSGQFSKDKKDTQIALEAEGSMPHKEGLVTTAGVDIQTVGRQLAYTARSETRWKNASNNKTSAGLSASMVTTQTPSCVMACASEAGRRSDTESMHRHRPAPSALSALHAPFQMAAQHTSASCPRGSWLSGGVSPTVSVRSILPPQPQPLSVTQRAISVHPGS
jgi:hypothetical protein